MKQIAGLIVALVVSFGAAAVGALATQQAPEFYAALARPTWAPPASVFGPVWTLLYTAMAVAAWLVWKETGLRGGLVPLGLFGVQLVLNALWSWLFFTWKRGVLAEIDILLLVAMIALTLVAFWRVRPLAGMLLLPYLLWVAYASALTFAVVRRNPSVF